MLKTSIKQYVKLHSQLVNERTRITTRLKEVDEALGNIQPPSIAALPKQTGKKRGRKPGSKRNIKNEMSLKEAVVKVLGTKMMTKEEILTGVLGLGYRFRTSKPIGTVTVVLYGSKNPKFKRRDGKFGVA